MGGLKRCGTPTNSAKRGRDRTFPVPDGKPLSFEMRSMAEKSSLRPRRHGRYGGGFPHRGQRGPNMASCLLGDRERGIVRSTTTPTTDLHRTLGFSFRRVREVNSTSVDAILLRLSHDHDDPLHRPLHLPSPFAEVARALRHTTAKRKEPSGKKQMDQSGRTGSGSDRVEHPSRASESASDLPRPPLRGLDLDLHNTSKGESRNSMAV